MEADKISVVVRNEGTDVVTYAGDKKLASADQQFSIVISSEHPLSLTEFGQVLKDLDALFKIATRETAARLKGTNAKRRDGSLVAEEFRSGSLEIIANPYFQGTVGSLAASAIIGIFTYVVQRINGKPSTVIEDPLAAIDSSVIADDKLRAAASEAVAGSAAARRRLSTSVRQFSLSIRITVKNKVFDLD